MIVFENENFIVADKPAGVLTTPPRFPDKDSRRILGLELQKHAGHQIFPVHRLDFEVSGLVLFAKNAKAHAQANKWFENRLVEKTYVALAEVRTAMEGKTNIWKDKLQRGKKRTFVSPHGLDSETKATCVGLNTEVSLWSLSPVTGRPHQLRVHMATHISPIVGDKLYGSEKEFFPNELALRATRLDFSKIAERLGLENHFEIAAGPKFDRRS